MIIDRCYDSHLHWLYQSTTQSELNLSDIKTARDVELLKPTPESYLGEWILGYGWDENKWLEPNLLNKNILDNLFPDNPVCFTRADGHAAWVNNLALKKIGYYKTTQQTKPDPEGGYFGRDEQGHPNGLLIDMAKMQVDYVLPKLNKEQIKIHLLRAQKIFNRAGFTHIRDMTGIPDQWEVMCEMYDRKELSLAVDQLFVCDALKDLDSVINYVKNARTEQRRYLRPTGVKLFLDGALGSEGAFLSQTYSSGKNGLLLWSEEELKTAIKKIWQNNLGVSIHTIGDAAVDLAASIALQVKKQGINGLIEFEHAEVIRLDTFNKLKELNCRLHIQPCHWLTDRMWLKEKLSDLHQNAFPWSQAIKNNIPISWGSDAPIEEASIKNTELALNMSKTEGIAPLPNISDWHKYYSHPDEKFVPNSYTEYSDGKVRKVVFDGTEILREPN